MPSTGIPRPDSISLETFQKLLGRYPAVIKAVSDAKGEKHGQSSLATLDAFRYGEALDRFTADSAEKLQRDDVVKLVAWKLRHGKFRPTLMKLVQSNEPATVHECIAKALEAYRRDNKSSSSSSSNSNKGDSAPSTKQALGILCQLRGIGPATASLLLSVFDPEAVIFFADEAYAWLCGPEGGAGTPDGLVKCKYNEREYSDLSQSAARLRTRLGRHAVRAVDIEKVAYVLLAGGRMAPDSEGGADGADGADADVADTADAAAWLPQPDSSTNTSKRADKEAASAKRKRADNGMADPAPTRERLLRSKR